MLLDPREVMSIGQPPLCPCSVAAAQILGGENTSHTSYFDSSLPAVALREGAGFCRRSDTSPGTLVSAEILFDGERGSVCNEHNPRSRLSSSEMTHFQVLRDWVFGMET